MINYIYQNNFVTPIRHISTTVPCAISASFESKNNKKSFLCAVVYVVHSTHQKEDEEALKSYVSLDGALFFHVFRPCRSFRQPHEQLSCFVCQLMIYGKAIFLQFRQNNLYLGNLLVVLEELLHYSRFQNKHTPMFIIFLEFFSGATGLNFYYISLHILRGYVYSFSQIFQRLHLFKGLHLFRTLEQHS